MAILVDRTSRIVIQGITGREASMVTKHALEYGTRIVAGVTPGKRGQDVYGVPVYDTIRQASREHDLNTAVIYVPPAFAYDAALEAIENGMRLVLIMTERIPQHDVVRMLRLAKQLDCTVVGPNSVGIISPGEKVKVGAIGGDNPTRCFKPGSFGVISRSGGMTAECAWMVKRAGFGVSTCVSIGGDPIIGSTPRDVLALFQADHETKGVVMWCEPGTSHEEDAAVFIGEGGYTKPLIAYVAGRFIEDLPEGTVFGHAASIIQRGKGRPSTKIARFREAGVLVADTFNDVIELVKKVG
ncbi:MAG: CoA-binding protein [Chloroflexi bacterium]|nr:CoA-binding protein [Chloroflexota bacterium]